MNKPLDNLGNEIVLGKWYWAKTTTGKVWGVGRFLSIIGIDKIMFYIGDVGYCTDSFKEYTLATIPSNYKRKYRRL